MPRVKPKAKNPVASKEFEASLGVTSDATMRELDSETRAERARHDVKDGADLDDALATHDVRTAGGLSHSVTERGYYGVSSAYSYFRDRAAVAADEAAQDARWLDDKRVAALLSDTLPTSQHGSPEDARQRLARVEKRALSTTAGAGGDFALNFTPTAVPGYIADAFAAAVRSKAVVANLLHHEPLPPVGVKIEATRITTATTAAVQTADNAAASSTDLVEALVTSNMATVLGLQDMSQQLLDHARPGMDIVLATDLGNALGLALDQQIVYGSAASGQLRGFTLVSGITAVTKSNATPTGLTNLLALGDLTAQTAAAYGQTPSTLLLHPRRLAYIRTKIAGVFEWPVDNVVSTPALHSSDGASTNQDEAFAIVPEEIWLFGGEPTFRVVMSEVLSNTLTCRFLATMYVGLLAHRMPAAIGRVSGTEFTAPVFT
jgi:HK97 family phage major capsid protein